MTASIDTVSWRFAQKRGGGNRFFTLTGESEFQVWDWCATYSVSARFFLGVYRYRFKDNSVLYLKRYNGKTLAFVA